MEHLIKIHQELLLVESFAFVGFRTSFIERRAFRIEIKFASRKLIIILRLSLHLWFYKRFNECLALNIRSDNLNVPRQLPFIMEENLGCVVLRNVADFGIVLFINHFLLSFPVYNILRTLLVGRRPQYDLLHL